MPAAGQFPHQFVVPEPGFGGGGAGRVGVPSQSASPSSEVVRRPGTTAGPPPGPGARAKAAARAVRGVPVRVPAAPRSPRPAGPPAPRRLRSRRFERVGGSRPCDPPHASATKRAPSSAASVCVSGWAGTGEAPWGTGASAERSGGGEPYDGARPGSARPRRFGAESIRNRDRQGAGSGGSVIERDAKAAGDKGAREARDPLPTPRPRPAAQRSVRTVPSRLPDGRGSRRLPPGPGGARGVDRAEEVHRHGGPVRTGRGPRRSAYCITGARSGSDRNAPVRSGESVTAATGQASCPSWDGFARLVVRASRSPPSGGRSTPRPATPPGPRRFRPGARRTAGRGRSTCARTAVGRRRGRVGAAEAFAGSRPAPPRFASRPTRRPTGRLVFGKEPPRGRRPE